MAIVHVHGKFIFVYVFLLFFPIASSTSDYDALLNLKQSFTYTNTTANVHALDSWKPGTEPCAHNSQWIGIICENGAVSGIRLGRLDLSGNIDVDALASISGLRSVGLMSNKFSGPIPDFHKLVSLRGLYVTDNQFSGEIPSNYFSNMENLRKIWLSGNNFSGPIPSSIIELTHLMELHIESNHFSGSIPALWQPSLHSLDLSNNSLEGEIPSSLSKFSASSFSGNPGLCGEKVGKPCGSGNYHDLDEALKISMSVLAAFFIVLLATIVGIFIMRRKQERLSMMMDNDPLNFSSSSLANKEFESIARKGFRSGHQAGSRGKGTGPGKGIGDLVILNYENGAFGLTDLMKAAAEVLGNGALGSSYKATMANGLTVVVKRMKEMVKLAKDQFDAEMRRLGRLEHKNVLTPLAYHYRKDEKLLVYEFQPKGSLLFLLHGDRTSHTELTWPIRLKIVQGIARGLGYLHTELSSLDLPHGNIKSSNVLLTPNYEPLLIDYGFCTLISSTRAAQSLISYKSPEAILDQSISPKCDVYCLGIIILEILTGKFPSQYLNNGKGGMDLIQWVRSAISEGKEVDLFDQDIVKATTNYIGEMEKLLHIGVACTERNPNKRLDIRDAIMRIEGLKIDGSHLDGKMFHVLPSLRDGYADQGRAVAQSPVSEDYTSVGDLSGRRSFGFNIS